MDINTFTIGLDQTKSHLTALNKRKPSGSIWNFNQTIRSG